MRKKLGCNKGVTLLIALVFTLILGMGAATVARVHSTQIRSVRNQGNSTRAFYLAEAGLQRTLYDLDQDFEGNTNPSWTDGDVDGVDVTQGGTIAIPQNRDDAKRIDNPDQPFYFYISDSLSNGSYSISLLNISGKTNEIWVKSTGVWKDSTGIIVAQRTIVAHVTENNVSPWNATIFGGTGIGGVLINGNVGIHGSVHILGEGLVPTDYAINMSGSGIIKNNRDGIPFALSSRIAAEGSLKAKLRVRRGLAGLSGSATVGEFGDPMDGVYVTDGYGGTAGAGNVYSDNGTGNPYDLGDSITFPKISGDNPYTDPDAGGDPYANYLAYAKNKGLVISDAAKLAELANITPVSNFDYNDFAEGGTNQIKMDGSGSLNISGIVYIEGGDLEMRDSPGQDTIIYSGSGMIVAEGDAVSSDGEVRIETNILSSNTFPTMAVLGVVTPGIITFDEAAIDVIGAFYAETKIVLKKQTNLAGTLVSNYIDMSSNVPSIYQVRDLVDNLPAGMIDSLNKWSITITDWQEVG